MKNNPSVNVIIVNYKTKELTVECVESVFHDNTSRFDLSVFIVDNNSEDGSKEYITEEISKRGWSSRVTFFPIEQNGGFAAGNNIAIREALHQANLPDYIWLLNPDTYTKKGACTELFHFLLMRPKVGIVGSRLEDPDGTPQISSFRDLSIVSEFLTGMRLGFLDNYFSKWVVAPKQISDECIEVDWLAGASMMIRREVFEQVGLFDDNFFLYYEEVDFCKRARKRGWSCWYVPKSRVVHLVGAASGISETRKKAPRRPPYWFESRQRYFLKNHGWFTLLLADSSFIIGYAFWRMRRILQNKPDNDPPHFLMDFFRLSIFCKRAKL